MGQQESGFNEGGGRSPNLAEALRRCELILEDPLTVTQAESKECPLCFLWFMPSHVHSGCGGQIPKELAWSEQEWALHNPEQRFSVSST